VARPLLGRALKLSRSAQYWLKALADHTVMRYGQDKHRDTPQSAINFFPSKNGEPVMANKKTMRGL
jgi:hypothetical protein